MVTPKKSLGQNFLMHPQIAEKIVREANVPEGVAILEIGPGTGMLTRVLLDAGYRVTAVEADWELVLGLRETFADAIASDALTLVHGDIRSFDLAALAERYALIANIPYYITGEIMRAFLTTAHKPVSMTLLVQKEVAERIARSTGKESLLSLSVKAFGTPRYCFTVTKGAFRPKVDSAVISIQYIRRDAFETPEAERAFFDLIRMGFAHKRKLLRGNLAAAYGAERVKEAFRQAGLPEKVRSEDLSLANWQSLAQSLA
jgi:16S rRNA (adenine1518-N6/adenine1519-N6)-dimethyltransferase